MRKLLYVLTAILLFTGNVAKAEDTLASDKIYFFTKVGCPYCQIAEEHLLKNHPDLKVEKLYINFPGGWRLFTKCAEKFKLGRNIGTPLFCMDDEYIMGWSDENQKKFDELSKKFK